MSCTTSIFARQENHSCGALIIVILVPFHKEGILQSDASHIHRLIFIFLVAASLPIGIFPTSQLLRHFSLESTFNPIIQSVREGNFELLSASLYGEAREWLRYMGIWLLLQERLQTLCWRVFIRKMYPLTCRN
jgi:hypothetical protein